MKRKGFTLVEIIISLALLMSLCFFLMGNVTQVFQMIVSTKNVTERTFATVEVMEDEIEKARAEISKDATGLEILKISEVFGIENLIVYPVQGSLKEGEGLELVTVLAPGDLPTFPAPVYSRPEVYLTINGSSNTRNYGFTWEVTGAASKNVSVLENAEHELAPQYQWYVSRKGFNTVYFNDSDLDQLMPGYPQDYTLIKGATQKNMVINDSEMYQGRHLVLEVTPIAKSGKRGTSVVSDPLYIHGLPRFSDHDLLTVFLDAGFLDRTKMDSNRLKQWENYANGEPAVSSSELDPPSVYSADINKYTWPDEDIEADIHSQYVSFKTGNLMEIENSNQHFGGTVTVFAVARSSHTSSFLRSDSWSLSRNGFQMGMESVGDIPIDMVTNPWYVFGGMAGDGMLKFSVNREDIVDREFQQSAGAIPDYDSKYYIGPDSSIETNSNGSTDILEILIYPGTIDEEQYDNIVDYLMEKYGIV